MNKSNLLSKVIMTIVIASVLFGYGCNENNKERFTEPPWLGGSSIEMLEKAGNYKIFLELMDSADYREPITKQLFTLFVPNDSAFKAYFQSIGISSVADLSALEAQELFTLHVLPNPRSRYYLIYEYIWGEEQGPKGEYASYFNRKITKSTSVPYKETVRYSPKDKIGQELLMTTAAKEMPIFSSDFMEDYFAAPDGSDYTFIYRNSHWGGDMQWGNAQIVQEGVRSSSGFINYIDQVVPFQKNLDQYLMLHQDKYGLYYDLLQRFARYIGPNIDKQKRQTYRKSYNLISNIANEEGATGGFENSQKDWFTLFCPSDKILQDYLNKTVLKYYPSIDSVPQITLYYILQSQISHSLCFISKISKSYFNSFGDAMTIQPSDINDAYMCSNGPLYDMNRVLEPNVFTCVPGRLFFDGNYSTFLYALTTSTLIGTLANPNEPMTLFAPTNEQMEAYHIRYNEIKDEMETVGDDGVFKQMKDEDLVAFVQDHIHKGKLDDLSGEGYIEMASHNYIHYNNNRVSCSRNQFLGEEAKVIEKVPNDRNGVLYTIDNAIKSKYQMGQLLMDTPDLSKFTKLLIDAEMLDPNYVDPTSLDTIPNLKFLPEAIYWTAFIPDNNAMTVAESKGLIPTNIDELKKFLNYHFIRKSTLFDDGLVSGTFNSNRVDEVTTEGVLYAKLDIANSKNSLVITDHSGQKITVDHKNADRLVAKGVVHKITSVLKY